MTHTPGPWTHQRHKGIFAGKKLIAMVENDFGKLMAGECVANGRLIAAAPDLLEACRRAVKAAENPEDFIEGNAAYEALLAAIAKAEGA